MHSKRSAMPSRCMPDHAGLNYNAACFATLAGDTSDETFDHLRRSVELLPRFREDARRDDDFAAVRDDPRFDRLSAELNSPTQQNIPTLRTPGSPFVAEGAALAVTAQVPHARLPTSRARRSSGIGPGSGSGNGKGQPGRGSSA